VLETPQSRYDRRSGELANQRSRERRKRKKSEMRGVIGRTQARVPAATAHGLGIGGCDDEDCFLTLGKGK
jgi:hypothetical protein